MSFLREHYNSILRAQQEGEQEQEQQMETDTEAVSPVMNERAAVQGMEYQASDEEFRRRVAMEEETRKALAAKYKSKVQLAAYRDMQATNTAELRHEILVRTRLAEWLHGALEDKHTENRVLKQALKRSDGRVNTLKRRVGYGQPILN